MINGTRSTVECEDGSEGAISLVIPCRAEYVGLCRLVAGIVATRESLTAEEVADLKLVVTEACTCFLLASGGDPPAGDEVSPAPRPRSLRVEFRVLPQAWEITISDPDGHYHIPSPGRCDPNGEGTGLGLTIIRALVDSLEHIDTESKGSVIRMVKRVAGRPL